MYYEKINYEGFITNFNLNMNTSSSNNNPTPNNNTPGPSNPTPNNQTPNNPPPSDPFGYFSQTENNQRDNDNRRDYNPLGDNSYTSPIYDFEGRRVPVNTKYSVNLHAENDRNVNMNANRAATGAVLSSDAKDGFTLLNKKIKMLENANLKIDTGVADKDFDRVEYNTIYSKLFVRGNENTRGSTRRFLEYCFNQDYVSITRDYQDIESIKTNNIDPFVNGIGRDLEFQKQMYMSMYNRKLDELNRLRREYYSKARAVRGPEVDPVSSGSDSDSD